MSGNPLIVKHLRRSCWGRNRLGSEWPANLERHCEEPDPSLPSAHPQSIDLQPGDAVPVNRPLSLLFDGGRVVCFAFTLHFAAHLVDDFRSRNRWLAHCALHKLATLARAFEINPSSVMRARQRLQPEGEAGFNQVQTRRHRHGIEDPEILQRANCMLADDTSLRHTARELDLCYATLRAYRLRGLLPSAD